MSATGQNGNNDTQRLDAGTGTAGVTGNNDTQRIDAGTGTVRLSDNHDTQRIDSDTVRLGGGAPGVGAPGVVAHGGGAVVSGMGNAAGIMQQQNAQVSAGTSNTGESFKDGQVVEINGRNYTI